MDNELIPINEFQTAVPSSDGLLTVSSLNTESPSNNDLLDTYDINTPIVVSTEVVYENLPSDSGLITPGETIVDVPVLLYIQGTCFNNMSSAALIETKEELFIYLCEVLIRFDANPLHYQKEDYEVLLKTLVGSLIYLYDQDLKNYDLYERTPYLPLLGGVMDNTNLVVNLNAQFLNGYASSDFVLMSELPVPYSLPIASNTVLGGIRVGDNLTIDSNGILSATVPTQVQTD